MINLESLHLLINLANSKNKLTAIFMILNMDFLEKELMVQSIKDSIKKLIKMWQLS